MRNTLTFGFVVQDQFSLFGYGVARDLIRMADAEVDSHELISVTLAPSNNDVVASCGVHIRPDATWNEFECADYLFVCSYSKNGSTDINASLVNCLQRHWRRGATIVGMGTGVWVLAEAKLLVERISAADPAEVSSLRESYSETEFVAAPYIREGRVSTCVGGDSVTDLVLELLEEIFDAHVVDNVRRFLFLKPTRSANLMQSLGLFDPNMVIDPRMMRVLQVFDQSISAPIAVAEVSSRCGVSLRTLLRLTRQYFSCSPKELYMRVRLNHAEMLLTNTALSMTQIGLACGFNHSSHFSSVFLKAKGVRPSSYRKR